MKVHHAGLVRNARGCKAFSYFLAPHYILLLVLHLFVLIWTDLLATASWSLTGVSYLFRNLCLHVAQAVRDAAAPLAVPGYMITDTTLTILSSRHTPPSSLMPLLDSLPNH